MQLVQVTIRDMPFSSSLEALIRKKAEKLSHFFQRIISCRVVVEALQKNKRQGKLYSVNIDLSIPGKELVVNRKHDPDIYIAIRNAFNAITRQLEDYVKKLQGFTKRHQDTLHGVVARLFPKEGYGFIEGDDGTEYYFSPTNIAHLKFEQLSIGDTVHFLSEAGPEGIQAHRIKLERHHEIL